MVLQELKYKWLWEQYTTNTHPMVSNETVLMCGEITATNTPLCIRQSPQISPIDWYVRHRLKLGDYVRYYIPKTYHLCKNGLTQQGPKFFTKLFVAITHTDTSNILVFGGTGSPRGRVTFSGYLRTDSMRFFL